MHTITFIFLCTRLNDTYETTQMLILIKTFTVCLCDKYNFHELDRLFSSYMHICQLATWHIHKMGVHMAYFFSQCPDETKYACSLTESSLLSHIHKVCVFMVSFISQCSNKP